MEPFADRAALSPADAGKYIGVSRKTIHELIRHGDLPSIKLGSRRLIRREELDRFLAERERITKKPNGGAAA